MAAKSGPSCEPEIKAALDMKFRKKRPEIRRKGALALAETQGPPENTTDRARKTGTVTIELLPDVAPQHAQRKKDSGPAKAPLTG